MLELGDKKEKVPDRFQILDLIPIPILLLQKGPSIRSRSSKKDRDLDLSIYDRKILMH